jgi:lipid A 4'-phosphatase
MSGLTKIILALVGIFILFWLWPELDIRVSALFYDGVNFAKAKAYPYYFVSQHIGWVVLLLLGVPLWHLVRGCLQKRHVFFVLICLMIGPGLVVNTLFKDQWGRARPRQIHEFGGQAVHTPPLILSESCQKNCSFVSGDASLGFIFMAWGVLYRRYWWWIGAGLGLLVGYVRMVQGAHFLSDVLFCGLFVALVVIITDRMFARLGHSVSRTASSPVQKNADTTET